jgi:hypothetical protein
MKNQLCTHTACLIGSNLFRVSTSCPNANPSDQSHVMAYQAAYCPSLTNEAVNPNINDHYLPSGFYDALGNIISEEEYWRQIDHEQESGIPYARDRDAERARSQKPVSLLVQPELECASDVATHITEQGTCYAEAKGQSIFVNSLPSNCEVITFTDDRCRDDPLDVIPFLNAASGCYSTDAFGSVRVDCRPLPL